MEEKINIKLTELKLIKDEQRYIENKLNLLGTCLSAINTLIFVGITNSYHLSNFLFILLLFILLIPMFIFLLGVFPRMWFFRSKLKKSDDIKYNFVSKMRESWDIDNYINQIDYQTKVSLKITKAKGNCAAWTIIFEAISVIAAILFICFG